MEVEDLRMLAPRSIWTAWQHWGGFRTMQCKLFMQKSKYQEQRPYSWATLGTEEEWRNILLEPEHC